MARSLRDLPGHGGWQALCAMAAQLVRESKDLTAHVHRGALIRATDGRPGMAVQLVGGKSIKAPRSGTLVSPANPIGARGAAMSCPGLGDQSRRNQTSGIVGRLDVGRAIPVQLPQDGVPDQALAAPDDEHRLAIDMPSVPMVIQ